jgi:hypothetical protein
MKLHSCKHFKGVMRARKESCAAGLDVRHVTGGIDYGWLRRIPCINPGEVSTSCDRYEELTPEEVAEKKSSMDIYIARTMEMLPLMAQMKKDHPEGGQGTIQCPSCGGTVNYVVSTYNGHTRGACETKDCMAWME